MNDGWSFWFKEVICGAILNKNGHEVVDVAKSLAANCRWLNVFQSLHTSGTAHTSKCGNEKLKTVLTVETNLSACKKVFVNKWVAIQQHSPSLYTVNVMHIFSPNSGFGLTLGRLVLSCLKHVNTCESHSICSQPRRWWPSATFALAKTVVRDSSSSANGGHPDWTEHKMANIRTKQT